KRRTAKKGAFRTLFANVARKRHRAATAAAVPDIEGDVPSVGVARALVVILAIHVVAIAGIFIHSRFFEKPEETVAEKPKLLAPIAPKVPDDAARLPKIAPGDTPYPVGAGESYATIAAAHNVSEEDHRIANNNTELRSGKILRIPAPRRIVAQEPEAMT